ncbi:glycosyltransferase [Bosea sp. Tri-44]|uniref:glycosyltransferase n=1 Tax=Bosea sp. Tri-44 TaxID=1972137 RepID=UPI0020BF01CB|nr:glycosyltransferase [Bosea sp. Tri-44]
MLPLSIFIIARDEADRIGRTIAAVRALSDDIVVIDSGSADGTQAIAMNLGGRGKTLSVFRLARNFLPTSSRPISDDVTLCAGSTASWPR